MSIVFTIYLLVFNAHHGPDSINTAKLMPNVFKMLIPPPGECPVSLQYQLCQVNSQCLNNIDTAG